MIDAGDSKGEIAYCPLKLSITKLSDVYVSITNVDKAVGLM